MEDLAEFSPEDAENGKLEEILATHGVTDVMAFIENAKKDVKELQMDLKETCKVLAAEASNPNNKNSKLFQMWLALDKNGNGKVTVEDTRIILKELGFNFVSKHLAQTLFNMVDLNKNGQLDFGDTVAFVQLLQNLL